MTEERFHHLVEEVIRRLVKRTVASERGAHLVVMFTGATVSFGEAVEQVRSLLLDGFWVQLVFSEAAEHLLAGGVKERLAGFPNLGLFPQATWLSSLRHAHAVVVPLLSLNTVSKLSLLIADSLVNKILLHALLMGKPVIMARDGADPDGKGREELGFHKGNAALREAMRERLKAIESYGCVLTSTERLAETVSSIVLGRRLPERSGNSPSSVRQPVSLAGRVATAADVLHAHRLGVDLELGPGGRITPLARDLARQLGVMLAADENH